MPAQAIQLGSCGLRIMAYCHDSVGIGHLRRTLSICERIGVLSPDACFLIATGTPYLHTFNNLPRVDSIKLPALAKNADGVYCSKYLSLSADQVLRCRKSLLLHAAEHFQPHVLLVDKAPVGVCGELLPTLRWLRTQRPGTRTIFGMRDVEDEPVATIRQWTHDGVQEALSTCYDEIWVYGMQDVFDVVERYALPREVERKLRFMGYICRGRCTHPPTPPQNQREILVTVGGGTDGERVLTAYLAQAAGRLAARGVNSTLIGGPDLPAEAGHRLREQTGRIPGVTWLDCERCMSCRMRSAELVVAMGGYNTMCELAAHQRRALIIPRETPRLEQAIRARLWEQRGIVDVLPQSELSPKALADRIIAMLAESPTTRRTIDLGGLDRVAARFAEITVREAQNAIALRM